MFHTFDLFRKPVREGKTTLVSRWPRVSRKASHSRIVKVRGPGPKGLGSVAVKAPVFCRGEGSGPQVAELVMRYEGSAGITPMSCNRKTAVRNSFSVGIKSTAP